ncbi:dienelactone hydrolase family protein, partial [Arthrospira platensis SPKY2]
VLGIFGSRDRGIPMESVRSFEMALQALGKTHQIVVYDADHAFANPSGARYEPQAAAAAWQVTLEFLAEHL